MRKFILAFVILLLSVSAFGQPSDQLWSELMAGNTVFISGNLMYSELRALRWVTADGQSPPTTILSCSDSRVPAELVFYRTIGDLFVTRVAGNTPSVFDIASVEYAIEHHWTSILVVMGHADCGAVKAAMKTSNPDTEALLALVTRIREAGIERNNDPSAAQVRVAVELNVRYAAKVLLKSKVIHEAVDRKEVEIVLAYYNVATGRVERLK